MPQKAMRSVTCYQCGNVDASGSRFCRCCGSSLSIACPKCGTHHSTGQRFCTKCGAGLHLTPEKQPSPQKQPPAQKQTSEEANPGEIQSDDPQSSPGLGAAVGRNLITYMKRLVWSFIGSLLVGSAIGTGLYQFTDLNPSLVSWATVGVSFLAALRFGASGFKAALQRRQSI